MENITYYLKNKKQLISIPEFNPFLIYPNVVDPRNYAVIIVYPFGKIEKILRSENFSLHFWGIKELYVISKDLATYVSKKKASDSIHYDFDEKLACEGVMTIYFSTSNLEGEDVQGYAHIPESPTEFQKDFLLKLYPFFELYEDMLFSQYDSNLKKLIELNELQSGMFMDALDNLLGIPRNHSSNTVMKR